MYITWSHGCMRCVAEKVTYVHASYWPLGSHHILLVEINRVPVQSGQEDHSKVSFIFI